MWSQGLFVIDNPQGSFAFRLKDPNKLTKQEKKPKYPDFLKAEEGIYLSLYRSLGENRIVKAFKQQAYYERVDRNLQDVFMGISGMIGNVTFATDSPGNEVVFHGHAHSMHYPSVVDELTIIKIALMYDAKTRQLAFGIMENWDDRTEELCIDHVVCAVTEPWYHPVYINRNMMSLPTNMVEALDLLKMMPDTYEGVSKLKEIVAAHTHLMGEGPKGAGLTLAGSQEVGGATPLEPFIVVEGMDGTGKSTLVGNLCKRLGAIELCSPPSIMAEIRPHFDKYPTLVRRMFYMLGNYILGLQVANMRKEKPVVMDRYWYSTAAYAIASECRHGDEQVLPPDGHFVYQWPKELHQPSVVLFLTVGEHTRLDRVTQRMRTMDLKTTEEENWLQKSEQLRKRIAACYRNMSNPRVLEVEASGSREEVLMLVMGKLQQLRIV